MIHCIRTSFLRNDILYDAEMRRDTHGAMWHGDIINSKTGEVLYNDVSLDTTTEGALTRLETLWLEYCKNEPLAHDQQPETDEVTPCVEAVNAFVVWAIPSD